MEKSNKIYQQKKMEFLDSLEPNDLINGENFNQAEIIIDQINKSYQLKIINNDNHKEFLKKALLGFLRKDSIIIQKATKLFTCK